MILSAHQPCYLPWLGLFAKIARADKFVIFDAVPFSRHDYTNRVQIKTHHGPLWLTVPVEHGQPLLRDARIIQNGWQRKHLKTIEISYSKAPYFNRYFPDIEEMLHEDWHFLSSLDECLLRYFLDELGIQTPVVRASDYGFRGSKSALVMDMCKQLGADEYIFGCNGKDYADVSAFEQMGIKVHFQDYKHPTWPQLHGEFIAGLSVLDLLMNCGPDSLRILRT